MPAGPSRFATSVRLSVFFTLKVTNSLKKPDVFIETPSRLEYRRDVQFENVRSILTQIMVSLSYCAQKYKKSGGRWKHRIVQPSDVHVGMNTQYLETVRKLKKSCNFDQILGKLSLQKDFVWNFCIMQVFYPDISTKQFYWRNRNWSKRTVRNIHCRCFEISSSAVLAIMVCYGILTKAGFQSLAVNNFHICNIWFRWKHVIWPTKELSRCKNHFCCPNH